MAIKIGLDPGHGLKTAGKQTPDGIKEWTLNDKVRDKVVKFLSEYDCEFVHVDNDEGNIDESLSSRVQKYLNAGVAVLVSIHHNAFTGTWNTATGVEIYTDKNYTEKDNELATAIYNRLVKYTGLRGRGIKRADWTVICQNSVPAVLCEGGFMDGSNDYKYITSDEGQTAYAKAVAEGLIEFLGLKKKEAKTDKTLIEAVKIDGINKFRGADELILYVGKTSTETNKWGAEAIIGEDLKVEKVGSYGVGNTIIPKGKAALSGHDSKAMWILSLKAGTKLNITIN
jgi:N-acetylmuramoyl-L-alanine amidase